jgi:hypothetical protein
MQVTLSSRSHLGTILTRQRADRRAQRRKVGLRPMSEKGQKRRFSDVRVTSALPLKADIHREGNVRECGCLCCSSHSQFTGPVDRMDWANLIAGCSGYFDRLSLAL